MSSVEMSSVETAARCAEQISNYARLLEHLERITIEHTTPEMRAYRTSTPSFFRTATPALLSGFSSMDFL